MKKSIIFIVALLCLISLSAQNENYSIKNISTNTEYQDFGVTFYGANTAVFASSRRSKSIRNRVWSINQQPFLTLFKGTIADEGNLVDIELFSKNINSKYHESNVSFTKDLKTVYFSRDNYLNKKAAKNSSGTVLIQMYKAEVTDAGEWINIISLPFNSNEFDTGHPALNKNEDKLYFTSNRPGSLGNTDIYVVVLNLDGSYGDPINLGPDVNTVGTEMFPFIDNKGILYFSSDGYDKGKGNLDIYATKIVDDIVVSKPVNLGFPINSNFDDFGFVFQRGTNTGYFSSNREGGKGDDDIYFFRELNPVSFEFHQFLEGEVRELNSNALLPGSLVSLFNSEGALVESIIADKYGKFNFKIECKKQYSITGNNERYHKTIEEIETTDVNEAIVKVVLKLPQDDFIEVRGIIMVNINPIYFDLDEYIIRKEAALELKKVLDIMIKYPELVIELNSHTDSRAPDLYNMKLSEERVKSSLKWIVDRGIDSSRISGQGYGETELVNKCSNGVPCSKEEHQLNRRTEFVIMNPKILK
jgi:outer membrane protein OmpA-like peptidoglycan-associated protein